MFHGSLGHIYKCGLCLDVGWVSGRPCGRCNPAGEWAAVPDVAQKRARDRYLKSKTAKTPGGVTDVR